jgi:two-component system cell cycle response regulator DivK
VAGELILIVEDNEKNLKLVRDVLQFKGYRTLEARTAAEGLVLAASHQPALILLDIQLPDLDGVTVLGRLRASAEAAAARVIALTAFAMKQDRERFLAAGFDGYISKPINVREFPEQIRQYCETAPRPLGQAGTPGEGATPGS